MKTAAALLAAILLLGACGGGADKAGEAVADNLEQAADQSDPAAAKVLDNAADAIRDAHGAEAEATAQAALQEAGNAQAASGTIGGTTPPLQAKPHQAGDPTPAPKVRP